MPYKPAEILRALKRIGFTERRKSGSHIILSHTDGRYVVLPMHSVTIKRGLFFGILKQAGLTEEDLRKII